MRKQQPRKQIKLDLSPAETLDAFLTFIRTSKSEYKMYKSIEEDENNATQDLLHYLELEDDISYHDFAKLSRATKKIRQRRREAKYSIEILSPIVNWAESHQSVIKELEELLGSMRKNEKLANNKRYNYKTSIINDTLHIDKSYS